MTQDAARDVPRFAEFVRGKTHTPA